MSSLWALFLLDIAEYCRYGIMKTRSNSSLKLIIFKL